MSGFLADWRAYLQPASWRGVPFQVRTGTIRTGRRVAVHEYPFKDQVWPEDLGQLPRQFQLIGYVTGDDCTIQRDILLAAAEAPGPGELVHPSLGLMQVSLLGLACSERHDLGRVHELQFDFLRGGPQQFPDVALDTVGAVGIAADSAVLACTADFAAWLGAGLAGALAATGIPDAIAAVGSYTQLAQALVGDATGAFNAVRGLPGNFGRFAVGSRTYPMAGIATAADAIAAANLARAAVQQAGITAQSSVAQL